MSKIRVGRKAVNNPKSPVSFPATAKILLFPVRLGGRGALWADAHVVRPEPAEYVPLKRAAMPIADEAAKIEVTFFPSEKAQRKTAEQLTLIELRDKIQNTTKPSKDKLPWLKLLRQQAHRSQLSAQQC